MFCHLGSVESFPRNPLALACTLCLTKVVRSVPFAFVPVIVMPTRSPARTAYAIVLFAKIVQATSTVAKTMTSKGRKTQVNSSNSEPLRRFDLDILGIIFVRPNMDCRSRPPPANRGLPSCPKDDPATGILYVTANVFSELPDRNSARLTKVYSRVLLNGHLFGAPSAAVISGAMDRGPGSPFTTGIEQEIVDLYEREAGGVLRYAGALAHDQETAHDALQEAFFRFFLCRSAGQQIQSPKEIGRAHV